MKKIIYYFITSTLALALTLTLVPTFALAMDPCEVEVQKDWEPYSDPFVFMSRQMSGGGVVNETTNTFDGDGISAQQFVTECNGKRIFEKILKDPYLGWVMNEPLTGLPVQFVFFRPPEEALKTTEAKFAEGSMSDDKYGEVWPWWPDWQKNVMAGYGYYQDIAQGCSMNSANGWPCDYPDDYYVDYNQVDTWVKNKMDTIMTQWGQEDFYFDKDMTINTLGEDGKKRLIYILGIPFFTFGHCIGSSCNEAMHHTFKKEHWIKNMVAEYFKSESDHIIHHWDTYSYDASLFDWDGGTDSFINDALYFVDPYLTLGDKWSSPFIPFGKGWKVVCENMTDKNIYCTHFNEDDLEDAPMKIGGEEVDYTVYKKTVHIKGEVRHTGGGLVVYKNLNIIFDEKGSMVTDGETGIVFSECLISGHPKFVIEDRKIHPNPQYEILDRIYASVAPLHFHFTTVETTTVDEDGNEVTTPTADVTIKGSYALNKDINHLRMIVRTDSTLATPNPWGLTQTVFAMNLNIEGAEKVDCVLTTKDKCTMPATADKIAYNIRTSTDIVGSMENVMQSYISGKLSITVPIAYFGHLDTLVLWDKETQEFSLVNFVKPNLADPARPYEVTCYNPDTNVYEICCDGGGKDLFLSAVDSDGNGATDSCGCTNGTAGPEAVAGEFTICKEKSQWCKATETNLNECAGAIRDSGDKDSVARQEGGDVWIDKCGENRFASPDFKSCDFCATNEYEPSEKPGTCEPLDMICGPDDKFDSNSCKPCGDENDFWVPEEDRTLGCKQCEWDEGTGVVEKAGSFGDGTSQPVEYTYKVQVCVKLQCAENQVIDAEEHKCGEYCAYGMVKVGNECVSGTPEEESAEEAPFGQGDAAMPADEMPAEGLPTETPAESSPEDLPAEMGSSAFADAEAGMRGKAAGASKEGLEFNKTGEMKADGDAKPKGDGIIRYGCSVSEGGSVPIHNLLMFAALLIAIKVLARRAYRLGRGRRQ